MNQNTTLYDTDLHAWALDQAQALRAGHVEALDLEHLAEELESMGASERAELTSRMTELLLHLLKWRCQPERRGASWEVSIAKQRDGIADRIELSPSLRPRLPEVLSKAWPRARRYAAKETGLALAAFPEACPFTLADVLDDDFLPQ